MLATVHVTRRNASIVTITSWDEEECNNYASHCNEEECIHSNNNLLG